jgi:hypothetical protein
MSPILPFALALSLSLACSEAGPYPARLDEDGFGPALPVFVEVESAPVDTGPPPVSYSEGETSLGAAPEGVVALGAIEELGDSLDLGGWMYTLDQVHTVDITLDSAAIASLNANPWADVHAGLVFDEAWTLPDVALRIKGRLGSYRALTGKSGFKVDLNEFVPGENIDGVTLLNLNNMVQDNSQVHELMVYEAFRLVGLAAPRVGYVWVTVNGAPYGLYTNVEAYDQNSLRRNYADGTGNLYDGDYYMPVWGSYTMIDFDTATQDLFQQDEGVDIGRLDIHGVTAAVAASAGTESFDETLEYYLDVDQFLTFWAMEAWTGQYDGYVYNKNNYRVYFDPADGLARMMPWDPDWAFYPSVPLSSPASSIPYWCRRDTGCRARLTDIVAQTCNVIGRDRGELISTLDTAQALITEYVEIDPRKESSASSILANQDSLRGWIDKRCDTLRSAGL